MTSYTSVSAMGGQFTVRIQPADEDANLFEMEAFNEISRISIFGVKNDTVFNVNKLINVVISNCSMSTCQRFGG